MSDQISFAGQAVIVTGAGGGLGRSYALEFARRGASVVVNDPGVAVDGSGGSEKAADAVVEEIRSAGGQAVADYEFVGTPEAADAIVATALEAFGRLDAVVTNAGILIDGPFADVTPDEYRALMTIHADGQFWLAHRAFRAMSGSGGGRIVVVSSNAGVFGANVQSAYAAAKTSMLGLVNAIAIEGREHGIKANALLPVARTRMAGVRQTPTPELAEAFEVIGDRLAPENVMPLVVYLASDACESSGHLYSAVGGRYARVVVGVTDGWFQPTPATVDELAAHWDEVCTAEQVHEPRSGHEEILLVVEQARAVTTP